MVDTFDDLIATSAAKYGVPFDWVKAVMMTESSGDPNAYRAEPQINDASYGLMQLLYRTAKGLGYTGTPEGLYDPMINLDLGAKFLGQLMRAYGADFQAVYSAYNSGSPTKYQTSTQVATNVSHASSWLDKVREGITYVSDVATSEEGSATILLIIVAAVAAYFVFFR